MPGLRPNTFVIILEHKVPCVDPKCHTEQSKLGTGSIYDVDPTGGYVQYQNGTVAEQMRLIAIQSEEIYIGVE